MAVQGFSAKDFFDLARFSWTLYENVKSSREKFSSFQVDVECLLISVGSLDKGHTRQLIAEYIDGHDDGGINVRRPDSGVLTARQVEIQTLKGGLLDVLGPFCLAFAKHKDSFRKPSKPTKSKGLGTSNRPAGFTLQPLIKDGFDDFANATGGGPENREQSEDRVWRKLPVWVKRVLTSFGLQDMGELRSRFTMQATNLNLFMSRLTHLELQKQTMLLQLRWTEQTLLDGNWKYGYRLREGKDAFRENVGFYIQYLLEGGRPFTLEQLKARDGRSDDDVRRAQAAKAGIEMEKMDKMQRERMREERVRVEIDDTRRSGRLRSSELVTRYMEDPRGSRERSYEDTDNKFDPVKYLAINAPDVFSSAMDRLDKAQEEGVFDDEEEEKIADDPSASAAGESSSRVGRDSLHIPEARLSRSLSDKRDKSPTTTPQLPNPTNDPLSSSLTSSPSAPAAAEAIKSKIECDNCSWVVLVGEDYYACSTGYCAKYGSYDLCNRCYRKRIRCPGREHALCAPMQLKSATMADRY